MTKRANSPRLIVLGEVNGNVLKPDNPANKKRRKGRGVAPGQELPSVRTWFAGDKRPAGGQNRGGPNRGGPNRSGPGRGTQNRSGPGGRSGSGPRRGGGGGRGGNRGGNGASGG